MAREKNFDVDSALDNPKFLKFLADANKESVVTKHNAASNKEVRELHESFEIADKAAETAKEFLKQVVAEDLKNSGIELEMTPAHEGAVEGHVNKESLTEEGRKRLESLTATIEELKEIEKEVKKEEEKQRREIEKLGGEESIERQKFVLTEAQEAGVDDTFRPRFTLGYGRSEQGDFVFEEMEEETDIGNVKVFLGQVEGRLNKIKDVEDRAKKLEAMREKLTDARQEILKKNGGRDAVYTTIQAQVSDRIRGLVDGGELHEARSVYQELKKASRGGVDYLKLAKDSGYDLKKIDDGIKKAVTTEVDAIIANLKPAEDRPLTNLEDGLREILEKGKTDKESREKLHGILEAKLKTVTDKPKRILLKRVIVKLEHKMSF